jgi:hypothetical protein
MLQRFVMPVENTCAKCGQPIALGEDVLAENYDQVRSGQGVCSRCVTEPEPVAIPAEPGDVAGVDPDPIVESDEAGSGEPISSTDETGEVVEAVTEPEPVKKKGKK